jgi:outer membrane protein assembly factor BamE (lipoprotein component of BamABCDE complex)
MRLWLVALGMMAACSIGSETVLDGAYFDHAAAKRGAVHKGVTTKRDVEALFGQPYRIEPRGSGETWVYYDRETDGPDGGYADRTMTVRFDARSVVDDLRYKFKSTRAAANARGSVHSKSEPSTSANELCAEQQQARVLSAKAAAPLPGCGF